ncbi:NAD(P)-dependent oxidoreductase [Lacticaseibacillus porcinae]|uniref:NAD(P)-dependent oxidoreductase n=1 Tax=Lacticaseibacillus porcinae TaxID=1123687 RepID=UPI000F780621|nr:NAD(P)-dependent oxidoreductase [Lacticaseibacillus porcinae]
MNILMLFGLRDDTVQQAQSEHPTWHFIAKDDYQPEMAPTIDVIVGWNAIGDAIIAGPNQVKFVQAMSAGVDYLPLAEFAKQHIQLANVSGIHAEAIAEYVTAGVLSFARGMFPISTQWDHHPENQWELQEAKAVVYGTGHIGSAIAKHLQQFGVQVTGVDRHGIAKPPFDHVTTEKSAAIKADIIVNVMPLTAATHQYFDANFFDQLQNRPLFINVGRGPSVDEAALLKALDHQLKGAVLDVFTKEPLPQDSPFWTQPKVWMTPHISGLVTHLRVKVAAIFLPNVESLEQTGTLNSHQVNLSAGY